MLKEDVKLYIHSTEDRTILQNLILEEGGHWHTGSKTPKTNIATPFFVVSKNLVLAEIPYPNGDIFVDLYPKSVSLSEFCNLVAEGDKVSFSPDPGEMVVVPNAAGVWSLNFFSHMTAEGQFYVMGQSTSILALPPYALTLLGKAVETEEWNAKRSYVYGCPKISESPVEEQLGVIPPLEIGARILVPKTAIVHKKDERVDRTRPVSTHISIAFQKDGEWYVAWTGAGGLRTAKFSQVVEL